MPRSLLEELFGHATWAASCLVDACQVLSAEQLSIEVGGTYGSILETLNHVVSSDGGYLQALDPSFSFDQEREWQLNEIAGEMARHLPGWIAFVRSEPDPDRVTVVERNNGTFFSATVGIRMLQAVQHMNDHLSQVSTALTVLGIEPPWTGGWDYGETTGDVVKFAEGPAR